MRAKMLPILGAVAVFSSNALADDSHKNDNNKHDKRSSFHSSVIGSVPDLAIGGVKSGGAPWVSQGEASISPNGRIHVGVEGLLIGASGPANLVGTTATVTMLGATVVCGGTGGTPVSVPDDAVTPSPLSSEGNAEIEQTVTLPSACFGPVVLVRIFNTSAPLGSQLGAFIAATGLTPREAQNEHEDHGGGH